MKACGTTPLPDGSMWTGGWMDGWAWGGNGMFMYIRGSVVYPGKSNVRCLTFIQFGCSFQVLVG